MLFDKIYNFFLYSISMLIGACLGIGVSFIVNCTLIEISKSIYFAYVSYKENYLCLFILLLTFQIKISISPHFF
jgi:hypothetical protein